MTPSFEEARKEFGEIGAESGYKRYKQSTVKQDLEYDEIKELLLQIKEEVEGGL